jgi:curved DNA-binding protein CbpA
MVAINNAFELLCDADRRREYDDTQAQATDESASRSQSPQNSEPRSQTRTGSRAEPRRGQQSRSPSLVEYFGSRGLKLIDNRSKGGALWVLGGRGLEPIVGRLRENGFRFEFAAKGGRATRHTPAWWTKTPG